MPGCFSHFVVSRCLKKHMFTWTSLKGHDLWFVIGGIRSVWIVSVFQGLLLVIVPFRAIVENFSELAYSCHLQEQSNVCLLPSTKIPLTIAISFAIDSQFCFCGPSWASAFKHCDLHWPRLHSKDWRTEKPKIPSKHA